VISPREVASKYSQSIGYELDENRGIISGPVAWVGGGSGLFLAAARRLGKGLGGFFDVGNAGVFRGEFFGVSLDA
jgi:hypothetical protein